MNGPKSAGSTAPSVAELRQAIQAEVCPICGADLDDQWTHCPDSGRGVDDEGKELECHECAHGWTATVYNNQPETAWVRLGEGNTVRVDIGDQEPDPDIITDPSSCAICPNPHCDGTDVHGEAVDVGAEIATQEQSCPECGAEWVAVFGLGEIHITKRGSE